MSNPPEGWYPDPTGQPNTIRWWNGKQWTNRTQQEDLAATHPADSNHAEPTTATAEPVNAQTGSPQQPAVVRPGPWQQSDGEARSEGSQESGDTADSSWWQQQATSQLWANAEATQSTGGPHLSAVGQPENTTGPAGTEAAGDEDPETDEDGLTPFERARATWNAPVIAPAPPEHWTQREAVPLDDLAETTSQDQPKSWT